MLEPASTQTSLPTKPDTELMIDQLKIKFSRENQRINIEHQATLMTATIRLSPIRCTSDDITWKIAESGDSEQQCEEWGLLVDFTRLEAERLVVIHLESAGVELALKAD